MISTWNQLNPGLMTEFDTASRAKEGFIRATRMVRAVVVLCAGAGYGRFGEVKVRVRG